MKSKGKPSEKHEKPGAGLMKKTKNLLEFMKKRKKPGAKHGTGQIKNNKNSSRHQKHEKPGAGWMKKSN